MQKICSFDRNISPTLIFISGHYTFSFPSNKSIKHFVPCGNMGMIIQSCKKEKDKNCNTGGEEPEKEPEGILKQS